MLEWGPQYGFRRPSFPKVNPLLKVEGRLLCRRNIRIIINATTCGCGVGNCPLPQISHPFNIAESIVLIHFTSSSAIATGSKSPPQKIEQENVYL